MVATSTAQPHDGTVGDPIAEVLYGLHATGSCYIRSELTAPWGIRIPECPYSGGTSFHFIARGSAWLTALGERRRLRRGDLVLFLHGDCSRVSDAPDTPVHAVYTVPEHLAQPLELSHGGGGARRGWLGALRDDHVGRALALMHRHPERAWTVASLAAAAHLSRATLA